MTKDRRLTVDANSYNVAVVTSDFQQGLDLHKCNSSGEYDGVTIPSGNLDYIQDFFMDNLHGNDSEILDLTPFECLTRYNLPFVTDLAEVLIVTSEPGSANGSVSIIFDTADGFGGSGAYFDAMLCHGSLRIPSIEATQDSLLNLAGLFNGNYVDVWACVDRNIECDIEQACTEDICSTGSTCTASNDLKSCNASSIAKQPEDWTVNGYPVQRCLARKTIESCGVKFVVPILVIVIASNICKAICMVACLSLNERPLLTQGDAMASFLENPDPHTEKLCLKNRDSMTEAWGISRLLLKPDNKTEIPAVEWQPRQMRWYHAATPGIWIICILPCVTVIVAGGVLLGMGLTNIASSDVPIGLKSLWSMGVGKLNSVSQVTANFTLNVPVATLLANLPQLIVTMLYFSYNGLFTRMLSALEWSKLSEKRAALRVTSPQGQQRSTYFLQLPYRYSVPLWIVSVLLHWLLSQSLFLTSVEYYYQDTSPEITTAPGYSSMAIIFALALGVVLMLGLAAMALRKYSGEMPFAGNCSIVISAACHPPPDDTNAATMLVKWGCPVEGVEDVFGDQEEHVGDGRVGHCCITSQAVTHPVPGRYYA
ncbi:MAG: hypothetical protein M1822_008935 [Bathelium mastoideum]|nr:MAG: hypothetical protein M1822_008935 [Bathelium mastoideum]